MPGLSSWIRRARHRRGFGVHSPLAFRVVKEVLWPASGYGFYREAAIARKAPPRLRQTLLRAWRLSCWQRLPLDVVGEIADDIRGLLAERAPADPSAPCLRLVLDAESGKEGTGQGSFDFNVADEFPLPAGGILYVWTGKRPESPEGLPGELLLVLSDGFIAFSRPETPRLCYDF